MRTFNWTSFESPDIKIVELWDGEIRLGTLGIIKDNVLRVKDQETFDFLKDNPNYKMETIIDPTSENVGEKIHALSTSIQLNVIPEILKILPESEKNIYLDDDGNEHVWFKNEPKFTIEDGEIKADFSAFKNAKAVTDAAGILAQVLEDG